MTYVYKWESQGDTIFQAYTAIQISAVLYKVSYSFIFFYCQTGIFSAISQCRFWKQSQGKARDATNGRNHCQKYLQKGFLLRFIYHNSWKCHCQKYLHKNSVLILWNIKIFQDHCSVFLALGIYLSFKIIKGKTTTWEKAQKTFNWKCFFRVVHYILIGNVLTDYRTPALFHLSQSISPTRARPEKT